MSKSVKKKDDLETFYPEGIEITIKGEKIKVRPFVLKTRTVVLRLISEIFQTLVEKNPNLAGAGTNAVAFALINAAGERMIEIYKVVLLKEEKWLETITLAEEIKVVKAIIEVNDFPFLVREIQSLIEEAKKQE